MYLTAILFSSVNKIQTNPLNTIDIDFKFDSCVVPNIDFSKYNSIFLLTSLSF